jgi:hypothetical protein
VLVGTFIVYLSARSTAAHNARLQVVRYESMALA